MGRNPYTIRVENSDLIRCFNYAVLNDEVYTMELLENYGGRLKHLKKCLSKQARRVLGEMDNVHILLKRIGVRASERRMNYRKNIFRKSAIIS